MIKSLHIGPPSPTAKSGAHPQSRGLVKHVYIRTARNSCSAIRVIVHGPLRQSQNSIHAGTNEKVLLQNRGQGHAAVGAAMAASGSCSICLIKKLFSSMNCSSSVRSSRKLGRKRSSFSRLLMRMRCTATDLLGLATKTCGNQHHRPPAKQVKLALKTWNPS